MNWTLFYERIVAGHNMQDSERIRRAIDNLQSALDDFGRMGHFFHLEDGPAAFDPGWPRQVYHSDGRVREVRCQADLDDLNPEGSPSGWWPTLEEAQWRAGITMQFAGRGGIRVSNLPAIVVVKEE